MSLKTILTISFGIPILGRTLLALIFLQAQMEIETIALRLPILFLGWYMVGKNIHRIYVFSKIMSAKHD